MGNGIYSQDVGSCSRINILHTLYVLLGKRSFRFCDEKADVDRGLISHRSSEKEIVHF